MNYQHKIYHSILEVPENWNTIAQGSIFLQKDFLLAIEKAAPANLVHQYVGIFQESNLVAVALIQQIDLNQLQTFGVRDHFLKIKIRDFLFKYFAGKLLIVGNNLMTGQHAISFSPQTSQSEVLTYLKTKVCPEFSNKHLEIFKDFPENDLCFFEEAVFQKSLQFTSQPSMIFSLEPAWMKEIDYVNALSKKYRDQYKRCRKKAHSIQKRPLDLSEIRLHESRIHELYLHVAQNAPFNTFLLPKNHFSSLKEHMGDTFQLFGYFEEEQLIAFYTLFQHDELLETYFLGYDPVIQKEKMLYLNMLYDMVACAIENGFKQIQFGRTAMEIKSSIGAVPVYMYAFMQHVNPLINRFLNTFFHALEPEINWIQRHPFKN